jgi:hypothetical protein
VLLATLTASSSASLSDTTHITSAYNSYTFIFRALLSSISENLNITLSTNGGTSYLTSGYLNGFGNTTYISVYDVTFSISAAAAKEAALVTPCSGSLTLSNPNAAIAGGTSLSGTLSAPNSSGGVVGGILLVGGSNTTTSAINAIKFAPSTGTFTSGSIEIWGIP